MSTAQQTTFSWITASHFVCKFRNRFLTKATQFLPNIIITLGLLLAAQEAASGQSFTEFQHGNNEVETLNPGGVSYWKYAVPDNTIGFFTLKNDSRVSNFDIYAYVPAGNSQWVEIAKGESAGTQTELILMDLASREQYFYLAIANKGNATSNYRLYADYVNPMRHLGVTLLEAGLSHWLGEGQSPQTANNIDRGVTVVSSLLQGSSFGGVGRDLLVREFTSSMRERFGYGVLGDIMVDWSTSMLLKFYQYY